MKLSINNTIYQAIIRQKWLNISYVNQRGEKTAYYIGIKKIDIEQGRLYCDIFNPYKSLKIVGSNQDIPFIYLSGITSAYVLENSYYDTPEELLKEANMGGKLGQFLEIVNFDNNILCVLN